MNHLESADTYVMVKHILQWKNVDYKMHGKIISYPALKEIDCHYRGTLLSRILSMEKKTAISMDDALELLFKHEEDAREAGRKGADPGHMFWYAFHFVEFISELGHHIELTGDEFEALVRSDKLN